MGAVSNYTPSNDNVSRQNFTTPNNQLAKKNTFFNDKERYAIIGMEYALKNKTIKPLLKLCTTYTRNELVALIYKDTTLSEHSRVLIKNIDAAIRAIEESRTSSLAHSNVSRGLSNELLINAESNPALIRTIQENYSIEEILKYIEKNFEKGKKNKLLRIFGIRVQGYQPTVSRRGLVQQPTTYIKPQGNVSLEDAQRNPAFRQAYLDRLFAEHSSRLAATDRIIYKKDLTWGVMLSSLSDGTPTKGTGRKGTITVGPQAFEKKAFQNEFDILGGLIHENVHNTDYQFGTKRPSGKPMPELKHKHNFLLDMHELHACYVQMTNPNYNNTSRRNQSSIEMYYGKYRMNLNNYVQHSNDKINCTIINEYLNAYGQLDYK